MKTPAQIFADINMILARRIAGTINDSECIELIAEVMDDPDAVAISLDMATIPERGPDGGDGKDRP